METMKPLESVFSMKGGNGDSSYVHNSYVQVIPCSQFEFSYLYNLHFIATILVQLKVVLAIKPVLEYSIYKNVRSSMGAREINNVFRIADLGCATGMNTLIAADTIVRAVKLSLNQHSIEMPEFQVYFADLPSNDFNTLFRTLPPLKGTDEITATAQDEVIKPPSTRSYFASAVSGSHYGRLFPRQSLHFCHSSTSLQWLSQVSPAFTVTQSSAVTFRF